MSENPFLSTKEVTDKVDDNSTKYLLQAGYIRQELGGVFNYLPLGYKVLNNIKSIITKHLEKLGAQEILMSSIGSKEHWEQTGRNNIDILFKLPSSGGNYNFLNPTHEEIVTPLVKEFVQSYKTLPVKVFQTQTKFRNEKRPKAGIMRGREFLMNDMYSFHEDLNSLDSFYEEVIAIYKDIFDELGIGNDTYMTYASGGDFSKYSHEFQTLTPIGEDSIYLDKNKGIALNKEIINDIDVKEEFKEYSFTEEKASELANIFRLGTKFTQAFDLTYTAPNGEKRLAYMGCYGIGVSRAMGLIAEKFADEKGLIRPENIAPYDYYIIKLGDEKIDSQALSVVEKLENAGKKVIYDDRDIRFGPKAKDADLLGIPHRIVVSDKSLQNNEFEYKARSSDTSQNFDVNNVENVIALLQTRKT